MSRALPPLVLLVALWGCDGACRSSATTLCLDDGRIDVEVLDPPDGPLRVVPSAFLVPPGLAICLDAIGAPDAGASVVDPAELEVAVADPSVAVEAEPGDCPGAGVIGVAPGRTEVILTRGEDEARGQVIVADVDVALRGAPASLAVGECELWRCGDVRCPLLIHPDAPISDRVRWLPRGLTLTSDAPDVVTIAPDAEGYLLTAGSAGVATITGSYALFGGRYLLAPVTITVR